MTEVNYIELLQSMFPNSTDDQLKNIIAIVLEASPSISFDQTFEHMVDLLTEDGAQGPMPDFTTVDPQRIERVEVDNVGLYEGLQNLMKRCISKTVSLLNCCDKKDKLDPCTVWEQLKSALPEADPNYLKKEADRLARLSESKINEFVMDAIENNQSPTRNDKCTICYEHMQTRRSLECGHTFHANCIDTWLRTAEYKTCPICRTPTALI